LAHTFDVVIIGGGIVGSSIAYHLAESGCSNVLIVERNEKQEMGSTGKSMGGVRAQFSTAVNIRMSLYSIDTFSRFEELTGNTADYRANGYLFAATNERHLATLEANRERQVANGVKNVELLTREDISNIAPQLVVDDIVGGTFCPTDGFVDPYSVLRGFATRARQLGVTLWLNTEVTGVETENGAVSAVVTAKGKVSTRAVVNAAGAWAAQVAAMAGIDLPVSPLKRQIVTTQPFDALSHKLPMIIDMSTGFHFRPEGTRFLMAWPDPDETEGYKTAFDPDFIEKVLTLAVRRVPAFADVEVNPNQCWAGLYEMTPDHHAIIGPVRRLNGFFLANGFSGHGVMHAPATGRVISDLILHGNTDVLDPTPLRYERFAEGSLIEETALL
jgi:sarcosine oxidase subunit beta